MSDPNDGPAPELAGALEEHRPALLRHWRTENIGAVLVPAA